jgi:hypothetical protein
MKIKVVRRAERPPVRDMCPWMITVALESTK